MKNARSVGKKLLSLLLAVMMVVPMVCFFTLPEAEAASVKAAATAPGDTTFIVPEAIYLYPNGTSWKDSTSTPFQYYINNDCSTGATKSGKDTTGYLRFTYSGNTSLKPTITYSFLDTSFNALSGGSITLSTSTPTSGTTFSLNSGSSPSLGASVNGCYIQWVASFTDPVDGLAKKVTAYTYVYKPYVVPVGGMISARCEYGTDSYARQISWLSGIHSITVASSGTRDNWYYPKYTTDYGLAGFLTSGTTSYIGSTSKTAKTKSPWNLAFGATSNSEVHMNDTTDHNDADPTNWGQTSDDSAKTFNLRSFDYYYNHDTGGNLSNRNNTTALMCNSYGNISIDTSRYSNLNQIPNLGFGLMVTSNEHTDSGDWYAADYTDDSGFTGKRKSVAIDGSSDRDTYVKDHNVIFGRPNSNSGTTWDHWSSDWNGEGVKYAGPWDRSIIAVSSQGGTKKYSVKGYYGNNDGSDYCFTHCIIDLNATQYNKANLRAAITNARKAMAKMGVNGVSNGTLTSCYFDANSNYAWTTFQTAYKSAEMALGKVDGTITNPDTLATNLNNAMDGLKTSVILNPNGGSFSSTTSATTKYVDVGTTTGVNTSVSYTPGTATRDGWTFVGWATSSSATSASTTVTIGYNQTWYAIWKKTLTGTQYYLNSSGGIASEAKNVTIYDTATSGNITFTTPSTVTYDGRSAAFQGWRTTNARRARWKPRTRRSRSARTKPSMPCIKRRSS